MKILSSALNRYRWHGQVLLILLLFSSSVLLAQKSKDGYTMERKDYFEYKSWYNFTAIELALKGRFKLNEKETQVVAVSPGGFLKISKTTFGVKRSVNIESNSQGELTFEFFEGKDKVPFEVKGEEWLSDILLEVVRISGIAAEQRIGRILAESGVSGVVNEIGKLNTNRAQRIYYHELLGRKGFSDAELAMVASSFREEISSSSGKGELLRTYAKDLLKGKQSTQAFFEATASISSSSETGSVIRHVLSNQQLSADAKVQLLEVVGGISSSSEKGATLRAFHKQFVNNSSVAQAYFDAVDEISSSSERGATLRALLASQRLNTEVYQMLFKTLGGVPSDTEKGATLRAAIPKMNFADEQPASAFFNCLDRLSSNSERGAVLRAVLGKAELGPQPLLKLLQSTERLSSNTEMGTVLRSATAYLGSSPEFDQDYFEVLANVDSNTERGSTARAALKQGKFDKQAYIALFKMVRKMSSSSEAGSILKMAAKQMPSEDQEVKDAFLDAAKSISSDSEYRDVMESLF